MVVNSMIGGEINSLRSCHSTAELVLRRLIYQSFIILHALLSLYYMTNDPIKLPDDFEIGSVSLYHVNIYSFWHLCISTAEHSSILYYDENP
jgi:hypothetical protein